jgi:2-oxoglutarate dehydrogenase E1 component
MKLPQALNFEFIDAQYTRWKTDPKALPDDWQFFFEGFELGVAGAAPAGDSRQGFKQARVEELIYRFRDLGHLLACMDPLSACPLDHPLLTLEAFSLSPKDLPEEFFTPQLSGREKAPLAEILQILKGTYCRDIGVEYMHLQDPAERRWLRERMEPVQNKPALSAQKRIKILNLLTASALFESYLNRKYTGVTRFSLEGGDAVIPLLATIVQKSAQNGVEEIILGMAHRGRLNVQANIFKRPYEQIFAEFESCYDPENLMGSGDVKYHNGYMTTLKTDGGDDLRMYLVNNPSHLEAVNPVVEGIARARQDLLAENGQGRVMPLLVHGDAAFAGQGVVAETLNMSRLPGYTTGGTVHVVINNQIGYTTLPADARSTRYSTDVAKMLMAPVFHVHGEAPEAVVHVAELASDYRATFHKDVVLDVVCYRRYGHNEGDEPYFTQPLMYDRIRNRPPPYQMYAEKLMEAHLVDQQQLALGEKEITDGLERSFAAIRGSECPFPETTFYDVWEDYHGNYSHKAIKTGVTKKILTGLIQKASQVPEGFSVHPRLTRMMEKRLKTVTAGRGIDWATGELLAFGSVLRQGAPIRLSGQDVGRGTFSQRHSVLVDTGTGNAYVPLNAIAKGPASFSVYNSPLSEFGVLGFEYGYASVRPAGLNLWEAQFGDFVNNAQSVIDLFIASGQSKWQRLNGLVLLLPHGWEGLGPEHSSARLERFLQLCADDNMLVCNPTTPAQYFHLLRRQAIARYRKPLIVMTPKSLLRHPEAVSLLTAFTTGSFNEIIADADDPLAVRRVLFCSGKLFYQLRQQKTELKIKDVAIVRIEQLYPFPEQQLKKIVSSYTQARKWTWVQEEPANMGAWTFIRPRIEQVIGQALTYVGRKASSSPATGFPLVYKAEQNAIADEAVGPLTEKNELSG